MLVETPQGTWVTKVNSANSPPERLSSLTSTVNKVVAYAEQPPWASPDFHPPGDRLFDRPALYEDVFGWDPKEELAFITSRIEVGRVIEFGCGAGRLLVPLLKRGFQADGIDSSSAALRHLSTKLGTAAEGHSPRLVMGDLAEVALLPSYPAAFAALNTVRYLPDLNTVRAHLRRAAMTVSPGGRYLVHLDSFGADVNDRPRPGDYAEWNGFGDPDGGLTVRWELAERRPRADHDLEIERVRIWRNGEPIIDELQSQLSLTISGWITLFTVEGLWSVQEVVDADELRTLDADDQRLAPSKNYWFVLDRTDLAAPPIYNA